MSVNKAKTPTKDGKYWFFRVVYKDEFNNGKIPGFGLFVF